MLETSGIVNGEPNAMFRIGYPGPLYQKMKKMGDWTGERGNYHAWCEDPQSGKIYDPTPMRSVAFENEMDYQVSKTDKSKKFYREFPQTLTSFHKKHIDNRILNEIMIPNKKTGRTFGQFLDEKYGQYTKGACYMNCLLFKKKYPKMRIVFGAMGYWCMGEYEGSVCLRWGC